MRLKSAVAVLVAAAAAGSVANVSAAANAVAAESAAEPGNESEAVSVSVTEGEPVPVAEPEPAPGVSPRPWFAGWSSALFPGMGFLYLRRPSRAFAYMGVEAAELVAVAATVSASGYDPDDPTTFDRAQRALLPAAWLQNTHFVGIYDAWRTARIDAGGYRVPTPGLDGLVRAPLRGRLFLRPAVGIPLGTVAALSAIYLSLVDGDDTFFRLRRVPIFSRATDRAMALAAGEAYYLGTFYPVGIGEEALFRGVLQTTFEERFGRVGGWAAATLLFGSLHALNAPGDPQAQLTAVAATSIVGGYLGWLYQRDGHDLTAPAFFHVWYNVIVGTAYFLADPKDQPFAVRLALPF